MVAMCLCWIVGSDSSATEHGGPFCGENLVAFELFEVVPG